jgi:hypothetical protein
MNYQVSANDGLININTLSTNGNYFYKIKSAKELNKSAYGRPIAEGFPFLVQFKSRHFSLVNGFADGRSEAKA